MWTYRHEGGSLFSDDALRAASHNHAGGPDRLVAGGVEATAGLWPGEVGRAAVAALNGGQWPPMLYRGGAHLRWALALSGAAAETTPTEALALVLSHLDAAGAHSPQTLRRLGCEMALFVQRLTLTGITSIANVDSTIANEYIDEPVAAPSDVRYWAEPSSSTRKLRRSAVRLMFRTARALALCSHEPTLDLAVPRGIVTATRPLTDEEIVEAELAARQTLDATRLPAAFALAEAGASSSEVAGALACDVDLRQGRVWLHDGGRNRPCRWGRLTDWGVDVLLRRLRHLDADTTNSVPIVYSAGRNRESGQASTCSAIADVLSLAGLAREPGVRPKSVAAWAAMTAFRDTGHIEDAARVLGVASLDAAARAIGWAWR